MNVFGRVFDVLIFCLVGFLLPVIVILCLMEQIALTSAGVAMQKFSENVSTKGYVNLQMYEDYMRHLDATGRLYAADMVVEHELLAPEYVMRSIEEAEGYLNGLWAGSNVLHQEEVPALFPSVTDPGIPPAGTISSTVRIPETTEGVSASHVHTDACRLGEKHVHDESCYDPAYHVKAYQIKDDEVKIERYWNGALNEDGTPMAVCDGKISIFNYGTSGSPSGGGYSYEWKCNKCSDTGRYSYYSSGPTSTGSSVSETGRKRSEGETCGNRGEYKYDKAFYKWTYEFVPKTTEKYCFEVNLLWNQKVTPPHMVSINGESFKMNSTDNIIAYKENLSRWLTKKAEISASAGTPCKIEVVCEFRPVMYRRWNGSSYVNDYWWEFGTSNNISGVLCVNLYPESGALGGYSCSECRSKAENSKVAYAQRHDIYGGGYSGSYCTGCTACSQIGYMLCTKSLGFKQIPGVVWYPCETCGGTGAVEETVACSGKVVCTSSGGGYYDQTTGEYIGSSPPPGYDYGDYYGGGGASYGCNLCGTHYGSSSSGINPDGSSYSHNDIRKPAGSVCEAALYKACPDCSTDGSYRKENGPGIPVVITPSNSGGYSPVSYISVTKDGETIHALRIKYAEGEIGKWDRKRICGKRGGSYYDGESEQEAGYLCNQCVISLTPIAKEQVITIGESPDFRAKAVFADGHSEIVDCAVSGYSAGTYNTVQTLTLSYGSYRGSLLNPGETSCTVKLTIRYPSKICAKGHLYYLVNGDATPCPYCKVYAERIMVLGAENIPFHIQRGESLQENGIRLHVEYMNGRAETLSTGWIDNLDRDYIGLQTVTIGYAGALTQLEVFNGRKRVICPVCGYEYELYPDDTDPGCPKCLSAIPVFTGNVLRYKETVSNNEILEELYHGDGIYYFSRGDKLKLELWSNGTTVMDRTLSALFHNSMGKELVSMYSVKIRDEKMVR